MVTWPVTSRDLERTKPWPRYPDTFESQYLKIPWIYYRQYQWSTYKKWGVGNQMVTWPMTSIHWLIDIDYSARVDEDLLVTLMSILPPLPPHEPHKHNRPPLSQTDCAIELLNDDTIISIDECFVAPKWTIHHLAVLHRGPLKRCHFYFYDNFGKCGSISIILSLLDS